MSDQSKSENTGDSGMTGRPRETKALVPLQTPSGDVRTATGGTRVAAIAALVISVAASASALYTWRQSAQSLAAQNALAGRIGELEVSGNQNTTAIAQARQDSGEALHESQSTKAALDELRTRITRDRSEWLLAEADYLLSIANRKLRFENNVNGAIAALEEADTRLQAVNDASLVPVRSAVARDLGALKRVTPVDRTGIALQLSALVQASADLPFAQGVAGSHIPGKGAKRPEVTDVRSFFRALWSDIRGLVTIRRIDQSATPLLPPDQRYFLRQNLALKIDTARLALLQRDRAVYQASLGEAQAWMSRYFDTSAPGVRSGLETLGRLRSVEIAAALPEVDDALRALRRIRKELDVDAQGATER